MKSDEVSRFAPYLPDIFLERAAAAHRQNDTAFIEPMSAAVLFADVSGFTKLTEALSRSGSGGTEKLTDALNDYFTRLIDIVTAYGGDVVKFAGDALLAIWTCDEDGTGLRGWQALHCAQTIQEELDNFETIASVLRLRVTVGAGRVNVFHLGGVFNRWEFVIAGAPVDEVGQLSNHIAPGEIGLTPGLDELLDPLLDSEVRVETIDANTLRLISIAAPPELQASRTIELNPADSQILAGYLPNAVRYKLHANQDLYVGEMRQVTVLFITLPEMRYDTTIQDAQRVMRAVQQACYRYEGSINKISVDDKGVAVLAAMGLPPLSHEDDPVRGVRAAMDIQVALGSMGVKSSIGVCTGRAYCGVIGSINRREYTLIGDAVNVGARLMQRAAGGVLCDSATHRRSENDIKFDRGTPLRLKGKRNEMWTYRPLAVIEQDATTQTETDLHMVGRVDESNRLKEALYGLINGHPSRIMSIEGEPGVGKTSLLRHFMGTVRAMGIRIAFGDGENIEQPTAYWPWRRVFNEWLGLDDLEDEQVRFKIGSVLRVLKRNDEAALLNMFPPLAFDETEVTENLKGEARAQRIQKLIHRVFRHSHTGPRVLLIDDLHEFDSPSLALLKYLAPKLHPVLIIIGTRAYADIERDFSEIGVTERISLSALSQSELAEVIADILDITVEEIPEPLMSFVWQKSEGLPYYALEITRGLRDAGLIHVEDGFCHVRVDLTSQTLLPGSIEGITTSRIDALPPDLQLLLKTASIVGRQFHRHELAAIHHTASAEEVGEQLRELETRDLIRQVGGFRDRYRFTHTLVQDVTYRLMLHTQRRELHGRYAQWLEGAPSAMGHNSRVIAYHWLDAGNDEKAFVWLERAAGESLREHASQEVVDVLTRGLTRVNEGAQLDQLTHGRWERMIGEAYQSLDNSQAAQEHLLKSVAVLGYPMELDGSSLRLRALREIATLRWIAPRGGRQKNFDVLHEAACAYESLSVLFYLSADPGMMLYATVRALNLARRLGETTPVLIRVYANIGFASSMLGHSMFADRFCRYALNELESLPDRQTVARVMLPVGIHAMASANWDDAAGYFAEGSNATKQMDDAFERARYDVHQLVAATLEGDYGAALVEYERLTVEGKTLQHRQILNWGAMGKGRILVRMGEFDELRHHLPRLWDYLTTHNDSLDTRRGDLFDYYGQRALLELYDGARDDALESVKCAMGSIDAPSQLPFILPGFNAALAAHLLWRATPDDSECAGLANMSREMLQAFVKFAPIGKPMMHYFEAVAAYIARKPKAALDHLIRGRKLAKEFRMPFEEATILETHIIWFPNHDAEGCLSRHGELMNHLELERIPQRIR